MIKSLKRRLHRITHRTVSIHTIVAYQPTESVIIDGQNLIPGDRLIYAESTKEMDISRFKRGKWKFDVTVDVDPIP